MASGDEAKLQLPLGPKGLDVEVPSLPWESMPVVIAVVGRAPFRGFHSEVPYILRKPDAAVFKSFREGIA